MAINIDQLLKKPFNKRTNEEKMKIISGKKPRPLLHLKYRNENGILMDANTEMYDKITWLTACEKTQKMFCWPCLLMMPPNEWNSGRVDIQYVIDNNRQHEVEPDHLEAVLKLHVFIKDKFENSSDLLNPQSSEESLTISNDDSSDLRLLIESICHAIQVTHSNSDKFTCNRLEVGEAVKFFRLLKPNIPHAASLIDVLNKSPEIINGLVDAIIVSLKVAIEKEIKETNYVSVILSEHVLNKGKSQVSTILRYVKNNQVKERFIGFVNLVGSRLQHNDVSNHILKVKKEYHSQGKILSLSVDGAVLQSSELYRLFDINDFQCKYFVPCYLHEFGRVLIQSVSSHLEDCGLFFKTLSAIQSYFENEDNFCKLQIVLLSEIPQLKENKWYMTAPFITFLNTYRRYFLDYFEQEITFSKYLSGEDRIKMIAFKAFLENLKTIFLLKIFDKLFLNYLDKNMSFSSNIFNENFDAELMKFKSNVQKLQAGGFTEVWIESVDDKIGKKAPESVKVSVMNSPDKNSYIALFEIILNQIIQEIEFRQKDVRKLRFCNLLLECNKTGTLDFDKISVSLLLFEFPSDFDKGTLNAEMTVVKENPAPLLKSKTLHDIMGNTDEDYHLSDVFSQLYKLGVLTLTMPVLPPTKDFDYKNTKLKQIENFSYIPQDNGTPSGETSVLCIEKKMLKELQSSDSFYDDVIKKYNVMKRFGYI